MANVEIVKFKFKRSIARHNSHWDGYKCNELESPKTIRTTWIEYINICKRGIRVHPWKCANVIAKKKTPIIILKSEHFLRYYLVNEIEKHITQHIFEHPENIDIQTFKRNSN